MASSILASVGNGIGLIFRFRTATVEGPALTGVEVSPVLNGVVVVVVGIVVVGVVGVGVVVVGVVVVGIVVVGVVVVDLGEDVTNSLAVMNDGVVS